LAVAFLALVRIGWAGAAPPKFEVTFDKVVTDRPYTGRVYVLATTDPRHNPLEAVNWFQAQPFFAQDVEGWQPNEVLRFDLEKCLGYPDDLDHLPAGNYRAQAVMDLNGWTRDVINGPGNGVSDVVSFHHDPERPATVELRVRKNLPALQLTDTDEVKYVRLKSERLSRFYGRYVHMYAVAGLPPGYREHPQRHYPTLYLIPGFGGTIRDSWYLLMMRGLLEQVGFEAVVVYLDADCPTGHHVFADSDNNGPWGTALLTELIPYLEQRFRLIPETDARYLTGASSGGWSSLWLQVTYSETFGGVWSMSPDPVDFTAFSFVNIYDPEDNFLFDRDGEPQQFSRTGWLGRAIVLKDFVRLERVLGRGGQFQSFDAVFSLRGADGRPVPLWDRQTGRIDAEVAEAWKRYDIRMRLESNWSRLEPQLRGKLHLYCGDRDEFFLERAFYKLRDALGKLGSDAYVEVVPGAGHGLPPSVWMEAVEQMKVRFEARYGAEPDRWVHTPALTGRVPTARLPAGARAGGGGAAAAVRIGDGEEAIQNAVHDGVHPGLDRADGRPPKLLLDLLVTTGG
jgi:S-formylglutathione hydrolase FrmB